jgi:Protein of unknown function (DUF1353)
LTFWAWASINSVDGDIVRQTLFSSRGGFASHVASQLGLIWPITGGEMDDKTLARLVAADLGAEVLAAVNTPPTPNDATRAFGLSEAMMVGSFLASCAQLAVQIWQARQDRALLVLALAEGLDGRPELASKLDPEKRLGLIAKIVNALIPDSHRAAPSIASVTRANRPDPRTKQEWLVDWTGYGEVTRAMTQPILVPFADMDNWIVYQDIHWTPPVGAPANLPSIVSVPKGFVSDLASIPPYFWWALPPTGRYGHAAILHDWLYWRQSGVDRATADRVFEVAMAELNVDPALRKAMWAAVRVGGGKYWDEAQTERRRGGSRILKRMPETPVTFAEWKTNSDVFA